MWILVNGALAYRWCIYAVDLDDGSGARDWRKSSLSATKACGYLCVFTGLLITVLERRASASANALVAMGVTALFGRSMWKNWLSRNQWSTSIAESHTTIDETRHVITERRNAERGYEPS